MKREHALAFQEKALFVPFLKAKDKTMGKAPEPTILYNVEQWYQPFQRIDTDIERNTVTITTYPVVKARKISTIQYGLPYPLAKSIKRMEELKNHPKGTYFTLVKH